MKLRLVGGTDTDAVPARAHPAERLRLPPGTDDLTHRVANAFRRYDSQHYPHRVFSEAEENAIAEFVEPLHALWHDYRTAQEKYQVELRKLAKQSGVAVMRLARKAAVIRTQRGDSEPPASDDNWSNLM